MKLVRMVRALWRWSKPSDTRPLTGPRMPIRVEELPEELPKERSTTVRIALLLLLSTAAGLGLLVVYALGGQVQLEGTLLGIALGGIGFSLILWGKYLFPHSVVTEPRGPHASEAQVEREAEDLLVASQRSISRRMFLTRLLLGAAGAFGVAMLFPVASLGPSPFPELRRTSWSKNARVVDEKGAPIRVDTLPVDGVITVFPEGHTDNQDSQAIIVRVEQDQLRLPSGHEEWAPQGNVCYSKICTHAGCPVGLYLAQFHELQCPCHQSAFDVLNGAQVVFGPAPRPLPQLQIFEDGSGFLRAAGDFEEPVGPGFWQRGGGP
ncbi:MAG: ubiquinol-cytochrome c reductase iron-sulfur subunit [Actinomycetota bacterium]|nr:ubiquinol-cytochrome c reductase iron-sulfur subunit [Actinomycetota bacterium]